MNIAASEMILGWEFWFTSIMIVHILAGSVALLTFWIPLATVKGSRNHITSGIVFLFAMGVTVLCAVLLTVLRMKDPIGPIPSAGHTTFFLFLCLFTASAGWHGLRVFSLRKPPAAFPVAVEKFHAIFVGAFGVFTSMIGILEQNLLYVLFPVIGISLAVAQYLFWKDWPYQDFRILMKAHLRGMITCVIATITAFCVIALPRMAGIHGDSLFLWFGPTVVFLPFIYYWNNKLSGNG